MTTLAVWLALSPGYGQAREPSELRDHLLVVYNKNEPSSRDLAAYYADRRQIPSSRVFGIDCPSEEEIDRATYEASIRDPIDRYLTEQGWLTRKAENVAVHGREYRLRVAAENDVWAIVLMRGVPLKIRHHFRYSDISHPKRELNTNAASVDSELATLTMIGIPVNGCLLNPYAFTGFARPFTGHDALRLIMVTRLDAPDVSTVRRMMDDSLWAERHQLAGRAVMDARGLLDSHDPYWMGDDWLRNAASSLRNHGWSCMLDERSGLIGSDEPLSDVAIYAGWYEANFRGPWQPSSARFVRGAIAYHIHSFSASTLRDSAKGWTGPLLHAGAAASMGAVYEPYLDLTPHVDIFTDRLLHGYTLAESAYMSQKAVSWMVTVVGDPLYRPFPELPGAAQAAALAGDFPNAEWLNVQLVSRDLREGQIAADYHAIHDRLFKAGIPTSAISWEALADLLTESGVAKESDLVKIYREAVKGAKNPYDAIRTGLKLSSLLRQMGKAQDAAQIDHHLIRMFPDQARQLVASTTKGNS
jgi:uncharacterized protein (TIGR03790 family)